MGFSREVVGQSNRRGLRRRQGRGRPRRAQRPALAGCSILSAAAVARKPSPERDRATGFTDLPGRGRLGF